MVDTLVEDGSTEIRWVYKLTELVTSCLHPMLFFHRSGDVSSSQFFRELQHLVKRLEPSSVHDAVDAATAEKLLDAFVVDSCAGEPRDLGRAQDLMDRECNVRFNKELIDEYVQQEMSKRVQRAFEERDWPFIKKCFMRDGHRYHKKLFLVLDFSRIKDDEDDPKGSRSYDVRGEGSVGWLERRYLQCDAAGLTDADRLQRWQYNCSVMNHRKGVFRMPVKYLLEHLTFLERLWPTTTQVIQSIAAHGLTDALAHTMVDQLSEWLETELDAAFVHYSERLHVLRQTLPVLEVWDEEETNYDQDPYDDKDEDVKIHDPPSAGRHGDAASPRSPSTSSTPATSTSTSPRAPAFRSEQFDRPVGRPVEPVLVQSRARSGSESHEVCVRVCV